MSAESRPTPAMQRYLEVKAQHPQAILLFRIGDFYELFYEDAETAARVLGLTLTSRDKGAVNPIPMAGFPYHQLDNYLRRLISAGYRAAICEQMEEASQAKGVIRREVSRVVTPGTLTDDALLDPRESNYLAAVAVEKDQAGLAWLELSTGRFMACDVPLSLLMEELARLQPAECLMPEAWTDDSVRRLLSQVGRMVLTERPAWCFAAPHADRVLREHFGVRSLEGFGWDGPALGIRAGGVLLEYVRETQKTALPHLVCLEPYVRTETVRIDEATRRSLELMRTLRDGKREGSLLWALDETVTPMGSRLLGEWIANPLTSRELLNNRLDAVEALVQEGPRTRAIRDALTSAYDLARLTARVATGRASPRDLRCLVNTLELLPRLKQALAGCRPARLATLDGQIDLCDDIRAELSLALVDEPPLAIQEGGVIRPGYHAGLDELRDLARGGKEWIVRYQAREAERTGIPGLKVGFNKVFGYYLELTAAQAARTAVPADWIRKQTLKNQERFVTPELKQHEDQVLRAEEQARNLETELFAGLRERVAAHGQRLRQTAEALSEVDVLAGLAHLAVSRGYTRPELTDECVLEIVAGRHPVLDRLQPTGAFVPNETRLGGTAGRIQIITGPNMAGKSTYIRQTALLTIMAQIGSFVPAAAARIGWADRVFARVGASDELGRGQSTFMVEMTETARILHAATERSLVILDEIGRGTSTYDGISLAWAVTEYLHDAVGCRTLFATHYHELTALTETLRGARNWNVAVREQDDGIVFLHRIVEGAANKSYGIHVARLAGIPLPVIDRARGILETLEADHVDADGRTRIPARKPLRRRDRQLKLFAESDHPLLDRLRALNVDGMSPLEALEALHRLHRDAVPAGPPASSER